MYLEILNFDRGIAHSIDFAHDVLQGKTPRPMEPLASVHYIIKANDCLTDTADIWEIIDALKPEQRFTEEDVEGAVQELRDADLV